MIRKLTVLALSSLMCLTIGTLIPAMAYQEAPMLRTEVAEGLLPPVEERLPENPLVLEPFKEIGQYGGTLRRIKDGTDRDRYRTLTYNDNIVRWDYDKQVVPNIAESWDFSSDAKELTLFLRKGIKWSDGEPFTADDIVFWYEDVILNKDLYPTVPNWLVIGGEVGKFTKLDDYTVKLSFAKPYGLLMENLAFAGREIWAPKHYLEQFFPKYSSLEKVNKLAEDAGFPSWAQLATEKIDYVINPDLPVMKAWQLKESLLGIGRTTAVRNPYYWKVDPAGNQLPYIDKITFELVTEREVETFKLLSGEVDLDFYGVYLEDYTLYKEAEREGKIRLLEWDVYEVGAAVLFNLNAPDPELRKIFRNVKFRQAASLALNRDEINDIRYLGKVEPRQFTHGPLSPYYLEGAEEYYIEYDPGRANELLDEIGLSARNEEGFRLRSDGEPLVISMDIRDEREVEAELCKVYLAAVGIDLQLSLRERTYFHLRQQNSEHDATYDGMGGSPLLITADFFIPTGLTTAEGIQAWCPQWGAWIETDGAKGEEPPKEILRIVELYEQLKMSADPEERASIGREIMRIHRDNLWIIGVTGMGKIPFVITPNLRNFPEEADFIGDYTYYSWSAAEQYFFEQK